jgi:triphosphatase
MASHRHDTTGQAEAQDAPREIELKLELAPAEIDRLLTHPILGRARPTPKQGGTLHAVYFDTEDEALRQAGLSLRIRRRGQDRVQTIKAERKARDRHGEGLALDRSEWESPVEGDVPDFAAAAGTALAPFAANEKLRDRIRPVFTVTTERRTYAIERDGAAIELALDRAEVAAGPRASRFGEVELELKHGDAAAIFRVALDLSQAAPVRLSLATKSERGYALLGRLAPKPVKAERIKLQRDATTSADAFRIIARSCLSQLIRNEAILRDAHAPEALHQMRVGLRRLRAALSLFKDMLADRESRIIRSELRWISRRLGPIRDLDVFILRIRNAAEAAGGGSEDILAEAEQRRAEALEELLGLLAGERFRHSVLSTAAWIEAGDWLLHDDPAARQARQRPAEQHAAAELSKRWKRVLKRAKHIARLETEERHRVRIEIKKLRYGTEFFHGLFPGQRAQEHRQAAVAILEELQETLGELNDIATAGGLIAASEAEGDGSMTYDSRTNGSCGPAWTSAGDRERHAVDLLARAQADYRRLAKSKPFWT